MAFAIERECAEIGAVAMRLASAAAVLYNYVVVAQPVTVVAAAAVALCTHSKLSYAAADAASEIANLLSSQLKVKPFLSRPLLKAHCGPLQQPTSMPPAFLYYCHSRVPMVVSD